MYVTSTIFITLDYIHKRSEVKTDRYHFVETDIDIFYFFHRYLAGCADIRLETDTDIPKFAYRYTGICQYFDKYFGKNQCGLLTAATYGSLTNKVDKLNHVTCKARYKNY